MEEKKHRDHRELGQLLDLFSFHDISPGTVFWHGNGMIIWRELEKYLREKLDASVYQEVSTPILVKKELFEKSGHWEHYRDNMFWFANPNDKNEILAIKPMNCPESTLIYSSKIRSYRDLPIRLSEITDRIYRNELSGTLGGLLRVRQMTQDDAHIYVRTDQIESEIKELMDLIKVFYANFDMILSFNLATMPEKAMGDPKLWEQAETALENVLKVSGVKYKTIEKDGAFYGPKIDINVTDSQAREWTIATIQLDFQTPERMELEYIDENGDRKRPIMIHRAILGSFERFIGILLEHFDGALPLWLSPVQVAVVTINESNNEYVKSVETTLKKSGVRIETDARNESIGKKIREAETKRIPYIITIGDKEATAKTLSVRKRNEGDVGSLTTEALLAIINKELHPEE
jgi:threonyl-tRNA synthetase